MAIYGSDTSLTEVNNSEELPCLNILSIDFDWVMAPSIALYNSNVAEDHDFWDEISDTITHCHLPLDYEKYLQLVQLTTWLKPTDIGVAESHKEIITMLSRWLQKGQKFCIYNIDHHHDCGYAASDNLTYDDLTTYWTCANWVAYLARKLPKQFQQYVFIGNPNSKAQLESEVESIIPKYTYTTDISQLKNVEFDKIFLCHSSAWVPPIYSPLFESLKITFENLIKK